MNHQSSSPQPVSHDFLVSNKIDESKTDSTSLQAPISLNQIHRHTCELVNPQLTKKNQLFGNFLNNTLRAFRSWIIKEMIYPNVSLYVHFVEVNIVIIWMLRSRFGKWTMDYLKVLTNFESTLNDVIVKFWINHYKNLRIQIMIIQVMLQQMNYILTLYLNGVSWTSSPSQFVKIVIFVPWLKLSIQVLKNFAEIHWVNSWLEKKLKFW